MSTRRQRRKFTAEFKSKVAIEAIRGEMTLAELSTKYDIHGNQILKWKRDFLDNAAVVFEKRKVGEEVEREKDRLYKKIGQLEMERDFLKKTAERWGVNSDWQS